MTIKSFKKLMAELSLDCKPMYAISYYERQLITLSEEFILNTTPKVINSIRNSIKESVDNELLDIAQDE